MFKGLRWEVRIYHAIVGAREDPRRVVIGSSQAVEWGQIVRNQYTIRWKVYNLHLSGHITMRQISFDDSDKDSELGACTKDLNKIAIRVRESLTRDKKTCLACKNLKKM
jgi:hypothetical protein